ncbi:MAG: hypothetical protein KAU62_17490, partial [Candidatus Heimdallarchaeota archaeon]|nr:hypothetical protein [Candidatus Heimdallarchaeota archaeon]MCK4612954.1 hypothetical protein [Candidatus Heimdallarchaeota archaeon]
MKNKKNKLFIGLSVLIIGFLISTSSLNVISTQALVDENHNHYTIDSFVQSTLKWNATEVVSTESTGISGAPSLSVSPTGTVHLAWEDYTAYAGSGTDWDIFYKRWDATTSLWTTTEVVSTESTGESGDPSLAVDSAENIHIAWEDETDYAGAGTDYDIFYKRWDASTSLWITTEVVSTESTGDSYFPSLAVDSAGNIHIAWWDYTDYAGAGGTEWDI